MRALRIEKYTTLKAIARKAGCPYINAYYQMRRGDFFPPNHLRPGGVRKWYTEAEGELILQALTGRVSDDL